MSVALSGMITVIGGSGFIGTQLCQNLADQQVAFEIVDLKQSRRFPKQTKIADIRDYEALKAAVSGETIIHLAAVHRDDVRDRTLYYDTNVNGTHNVCRVAEEKGISRIVFTSTVAVYGFAPPDTGEDGKVAPFNDYGTSKFEGEEILRAWYAADEKNRTLTIVRPTVVFGIGNRGNVYNLLKQIQSGKFLMVGSGRNRKSMAYVENIAAFLESVAKRDSGYGLHNYIDKPDLDMNSLVSRVNGKLTGNDRIGLRLPYWLGLTLGFVGDFISRVTGIDLPVSSIRIKKFCSTTAFSSNAPEVPGYTGPYTLEEGLEKTLDAEFLHSDPNREVFFTE